MTLQITAISEPNANGNITVSLSHLGIGWGTITMLPPEPARQINGTIQIVYQQTPVDP